MDNISEPNSKLSYEEILKWNAQLKKQIKGVQIISKPMKLGFKFVILFFIFFAQYITCFGAIYSNLVSPEFSENNVNVSLSDTTLQIRNEEPQRNRIIVGGDFNYPPYEFLDKNGQPTGFNVELTDAIAEEMGLDVVVELKPWAQTLHALLNKEIDIVQGMFYSTERDKIFDLSQPHSLISHVFVCRTNTQMPNDLEELRSKKVVVMRGDIMHDLLVQNEFNEQIILAETQQQALEWLSEGKYEFALIAKIPALYWIRMNGWKNLEVGNEPIINPDYCYASLVNNNLIFQFSEGLKILKEKGKYREIYNKWLGVYEDQSLTFTEKFKYLAYFTLPLVLLLFFSIIWSRTLKKRVAEKTKELLCEIDERKKKEQELIKNQFYLSKAQEIGKIGTWELDIINNNLIWTKENYKNFGLSYGTPLTYEIFINCIHPDDRDYVNSEWTDSVNGKPYDIEHRVIEDGKVKWLREKADVKFDENGKAISAIGFTQDITKFKESEIKLKEGERKFRILADSTNDWEYWLDENNKYVFISPSCKKITGYSEKEFYENPDLFMDLVCGDYRDEVFIHYHDSNRTKPQHTSEFPIMNKNNKEIWIEHSCIPIFDEEGQFLGRRGNNRDITERKITERELLLAKEQVSSSLQQIKVIQANTPNIIWKWDFDKDGNYTNTYISEAADEFLALPEGSIDNSLDKFFSYILPEFLPNVNDAIKNAIENPNTLIFVEYEIKKADGKLAWFSSSGKVIPENNKLTIYGSTIDTTEKKQNEQKLLRSDRVFNLALDMFCIAGFDGYFKYLNPAWKKTLGWSIEELLSKPWLDFVHPDDAKDTENIKSVIVDGKEIYKFENRYISKDGSIKWLSWNSHPFPKENIMIGAVRDITEAKKIENELLHAKNKAEVGEANITAILEGTNNSIWAFSRDYQILFINQVMQQEFLQSFGVLLEIGTNLIEALPESLQPFWKPRYDRVLANEPFTIEDAVPTNNGTIYIEVSFNPIVKNGQVIGGSCFANNITSRKLAEIELINAKEKAEESERLKTAFLANMSHEIRTPMNGILGFTSLLQDSNLSVESQKDYLEIIEKSGDRLLNTVNDIIEISKIESGDISVNKSEVNIINHLDTLVTFFKPEAKKKNIDIIVGNNINGNDLMIATDKNKLSSILSNLIKNAIKYTDEGTINVGLKIENGEILFSCQDSGIGIPKNRQEAIFNRFEQADIDDKHALQGSGLGLAIVKSYVEMLDGKTWVESAEGKGSIFYVSLPFEHEKKKEQIIPQKAKSSDSGFININVLIAEDDEFSSMHLSAVLNGRVKNISIAQNGIEAVEMCKNDSGIDLILMDLKMPTMDGIEATKKIREFNSDVVIIAQTAYALEGDKEKAIEAGCNDYISKPIKKDKLIELINKYF